MSSAHETNSDILRAELSSRIQDALVLRDWVRLEHWARQWIQIEPKNPSGFKWLARASVALKKIQKAAYAYGRLLDFESDNEEAKKFFQDFPSSWKEQPATRVEKLQAPSAPAMSAEDLKKQALGIEKRQQISTKSAELAALYFSLDLFSAAARLFKDAFDWQPGQSNALGYARSLHKAQNSREAITFLNRQIGAIPRWIEGRLLLGRIHFELGQRTEAQKEWQAVLKLDPQNREALEFIRSLITHSATY